MRKSVRWCAARSERLRMQRREKLFVHQDNRRFWTPQRNKSRCSKLIVGEEVVQGPERLLEAWANHFRALAESRLNGSSDAQGMWLEKIR